MSPRREESPERGDQSEYSAAPLRPPAPAAILFGRRRGRL